MSFSMGGKDYRTEWFHPADEPGSTLEVWEDGGILLEISVADNGQLSLTAWSERLPVELVEYAVAQVRSRIALVRSQHGAGSAQQ